MDQAMNFRCMIIYKHVQLEYISLIFSVVTLLYMTVFYSLLTKKKKCKM